MLTMATVAVRLFSAFLTRVWLVIKWPPEEGR